MSNPLFNRQGQWLHQQYRRTGDGTAKSYLGSSEQG